MSHNQTVFCYGIDDLHPMFQTLSECPGDGDPTYHTLGMDSHFCGDKLCIGFSTPELEGIWNLSALIQEHEPVLKEHWVRFQREQNLDLGEGTLFLVAQEHL